MIKSSSLIVMLAVHSFAFHLSGENKKKVVVPEAVWKLAGIQKPYLNDKLYDLYCNYDW